MISFEQVGKRYPGGITALADLTLAVESGEMVILSGHSGAGKSTLLRLFDRSAFDNVMLPLAIAGVAPRDAGRRVRAALDKVGLLDREKAIPVALSGGEQQRLAIARAVVARPSILIADEPTAHLDDDTARDIAAMFRSFNQVGVTVLVATHHEALFAPYMTRRIVLSRGRISS